MKFEKKKFNKDDYVNYLQSSSIKREIIETSMLICISLRLTDNSVDPFLITKMYDLRDPSPLDLKQH